MALHPGLTASYLRNVEKLPAALNASGLEAGEARMALRNPIALIAAEAPRKAVGST